MKGVFTMLRPCPKRFINYAKTFQAMIQEIFLKGFFINFREIFWKGFKNVS